MDEKTLNILLKFALDGQALSRVQSGVTSLESELDKARGKALATQQALLDMSDGAKKAGQSYAKIFAAGVGITGGIFAAAERYVKNAQVATELTKQWTQQTERLQATQNRIGAVLAREALPMLKQAADLAGKAANFVEKNPEIVRAALNIGAAVASIGAVGMAVTKGIKLYADAKFALIGLQQLTAGKLMADAAKTQLAAAAAGKYGVAGGLIGPATAGEAAAGGGIAASSALLPIVTAVVSLLAGSYLGTKLGNFGGKSIYGDQWQDKGFKESMKDVFETTKKIAILASPLHILAGEAEKLGLISADTRAKIFELQKAILGLGDKAESVGAKAGNPNFTNTQVTDSQKQLVDSYAQMLDDEKKATEDYYNQRNDIITQANREALAMGASHAKSMLQLDKRYDQQVTSITADYQKSAMQFEQNYASQRAQIVRDGGIAIQEIEARHQEALRKLTDEHNQRVADLVAGRDALGLVREQRDFEKKKSEMERDTNQEIAARRRDIALRLADLTRAHQQERAQRLADYKEQLAQAKQQHDEEAKQQAEAYTEQMRQQSQAKADALRELDKSYRTEQQRRREAFIAQVRDLDASLLGEQKTKRNYYAAMLKDVDAFLKSWRDKIPAGGSGNVPIRDMGGYAERGVYGLAQDGRREFVLSGPTTRAAEEAIGTSLSQSSIMRALTGRNAITVYDHRRFDSRLTAEDRRAIQADTYETLRELIPNV
ncbi:MAG TPA: hypothetical protein PLN86_16495 [Candidatus Hydrogenedentes bacterium]|nr:hypothetical protein [Candidatus Hydrogenedentota bacterium]